MKPVLRWACAWLGATTLGGCHAPLVRDAGTSDLGLTGFPSSTELVELMRPSRPTLRGIFVPSAPSVSHLGLIVHFLPTGASWSTGLEGGFGGIPETLAFLSEKGWDALLVDHRGVGGSEGKRIPEHLAEDGWAVWGEALRRRVRGKPILLRGVSLGSLSVAALLDRRVDVDGVILHAPVRSDTVVGAASRERFGRVLGAPIGWIHRDPGVADLWNVLPAPCATLVVLPEEDMYLGPKDHDSFRRLAESSSHPFEVVLRPERDHAEVVLAAYTFELREHSGRLTGALSEDESKFLDRWAKDHPGIGTE